MNRRDALKLILGGTAFMAVPGLALAKPTKRFSADFVFSENVTIYGAYIVHSFGCTSANWSVDDSDPSGQRTFEIVVDKNAVPFKTITKITVET